MTSRGMLKGFGPEVSADTLLKLITDPEAHREEVILYVKERKALDKAAATASKAESAALEQNKALDGKLAALDNRETKFASDTAGAMVALDSRTAALDSREGLLNDRVGQLNQRENEINDRQAKLEGAEAAFAGREREIQAMSDDMDTREQDLDVALKNLSRRENLLKTRINSLMADL